jgi:hypothetical protein
MTASDFYWVVGKDTNFLVQVKETYGNKYQLRVLKYAIFCIFRKSSLILERISKAEDIQRAN